MHSSTNTTLRRLALGAVLGGAFWLGLTALDGAAHADDVPAAVAESPGGAPGDVLVEQVITPVVEVIEPEQTTGAVTEVVDQVLPEVKPTKEPKPTEEPKPSDEPAHHADEQDAQQAPDKPKPANPIEAITDGVEQVITPVVEVIEPVTDIVETVTAPLPLPKPTPPPTPAPTSTPVAAQPTAPASTTTDTTTTPAPASVPEVPAVDEPAAEVGVLPVVGPVVGSATLLPGLTPAPVADTGPRPTRAPQCDSDVHTLDQVRDAIRKTAQRQQRQADRVDPSGPGKPCPSPATPDGQTASAFSVKPPPPTGEQLVALSAAGGHSHPALHRLTQLRPRGDLPAGRSEHVDPRPA